MGSINMHAGDVAISCDSPEQAAALIRALQNGSAAPATRKRRGGASKEPNGEETPKRGRKAKANGESGGRGHVKAAILAAIEKNPEPDLDKLAEQLYGASGNVERNRVRVAITAFVKRGSLKALARGGWKVLGS